MKFIWILINLVQIILICIWSAICGVIGILLMLITQNGGWVHLVSGKYLWSPFICAITGVRVVIHGREKIDKKTAAIYVANHTSHFDMVGLSRVMPIGLFFIAKKELARVPFMGQYMYMVGHIFVDRKNKVLAMQSMQKAAKKIKDGKNVISFPEGTRSKTGKLQLFKRGAFIIAKEGQVSIQPIAIKGAYKILPSGSFAIRPGIIHIYVGERIQSESFTNKTAEELADYARNAIHKMLS